MLLFLIQYMRVTLRCLLFCNRLCAFTFAVNVNAFWQVQFDLVHYSLTGAFQDLGRKVSQFKGAQFGVITHRLTLEINTVTKNVFIKAI